MRRIPIALLIFAALFGGYLVLSATGPERTDVDLDDAALEAERREGPALVARGTRPRSEKPDGQAGSPSDAAAKRGADEPRPPTRTVIRYRGRVVDAEGRPIAGATVILRGSGKGPIRVNADGTFEVEVEAGRYDLLVQTDDGAILYQPNLSIGGDTPELVALTVEEGPAVAVVVLREGEPARSVEVALTSIADRDLGRRERALLQAQTLRGGRAVLGKPPVGVYEILLTFGDGMTLRRSYEHLSDTTVRIDTGAAVEITGTVTAGLDGPGIRNATVHIGGERSTGIDWIEMEVMTDNAGAFALRSPRVAYRSVRVSAEGYSTWPPIGGSREERQKRAPILNALRLVGKGTAADVKIPLVEAADVAVRGSVVDGEGKPVAGVDVLIVLGSSRIENPDDVVTTDASGRFEVVGLRPGVYRAFVITDEWTSHRSPTFTIEEGAGDAIDVVVGVRPAGGLSGRVLKADGSPAAGARVWADSTRPLDRQPDQPAPYEVFTDAEGRWRIGALRMNTPKVLHASWSGFRSAPLKAAPYSHGAQDIELKLAPAVTLKIRVLEEGTTRGVEGARLRVEPEPWFGRPKFLLFTDENGVVELDQVLPATWRIQPWSQWHLAHDWEALDLTGKKDVVELTYELDPGLAVAGRVHDDRGEPLVADVVISGTDTDGSKFYRRLDSDQDGRFRVTGIRGGSYFVTARLDGYTKAVQRDIKGGEEHLDLKLIPVPARK